MYYQHHIQLKTAEPLTQEQALNWYSAGKEFSPIETVLKYQLGEDLVGMEYGHCDDCDMSHTYVVPLTRDITASEALFIVNVWEYHFDGDFDIELSSQYDAAAMGNFENSIHIDEDVKNQALSDMKKWHHNRWVSEKVSEGWRHGSYFNSSDKTHPAMRDWDSLTETHRRSPEFGDTEILEWLSRRGVI